MLFFKSWQIHINNTDTTKTVFDRNACNDELNRGSVMLVFPCLVNEFRGHRYPQDAGFLIHVARGISVWKRL
jgi:hypothetical protein